MKKQTSKSHPIINIPESSLVKLPTPSSISYMWNMGSLLGISLVIQIISGVLISMHYKPDTSSAFESTIHIMREVNEGNSSRAIHSNGASMFFIILYMHIFRGMLNSSSKKSETWASGTMMILILMATAFMGYVLPWGQMSFWGATVITNLASAIPIWGDSIVTWLWGGFSVSEPTLNRFLSLHFLTPFILAAMSIIHLALLHKTGSSNPLGGKSKTEMSPFHPLFSWKDTLAPTIVISIMTAISEKAPALLMDPENFSPANPMVTPVHIQPEWYFLFAYAILRSIPNKLGGVMALVASIIILPAISAKKSKKSSSKFNPKNKMTKMLLATSFFILTWAGAKPMEEPFMLISKTAGTAYFAIIMT